MRDRTPPTDPESPDAHMDDDGVGQEVRRTLAEVAPWAVSILAHLVLVVLALFLVWTTVLHEEEKPWSGEVSLTDPPQVAPVFDPQPERSEQESRPRTTPTPQVEPVPNPQLPDPGTTRPFVPAPNTPFGPQSRFDGEGPDGGPTSGMLGSVGRKTVFVIDASGSLIDTFPLVVNELKRLLVELARSEEARSANPANRGRQPFAYALVFFRDGEVLVQDRRGLRTAESDAVGRSVDWLDRVSPGGSTSPLPAIELALSYNPDTVILLSDNITGHGIHELNADDLVDRVLDVRGDRRIVINTVQFIYPDPQESYGARGTLERLAEQTGGSYRFVSDRELNLR